MRNKNAMDLWNANFWDSGRGISQLQRGIDRLFADFSTPGISNMGESCSLNPLCDVDENDSHYLMTFDLPGLKKEDVKIEVKGNLITVSGERRDEWEDKRKNQHLQERSYGTFQRSFTLPADIDANKVEANYENGVLYLAVPKSEASKSKLVQIGEKAGSAFKRLLGQDPKRPDRAA